MGLIKGFFIIALTTMLCFADDQKDNKKVLNILYENVILKDINSSLKNIKSLKESIIKKQKSASKKEFTNFVQSWKSVETFYILGDLNEDFIDTPRYIDTFHNLSEDITAQLDRAIKSSDEIRIVLFKNSLKSINALEYVLYEKDISSSRVNQIAIKIVDTLTSHLEEIKQEYLAQKSNFLKDLKKPTQLQ